MLVSIEYRSALMERIAIERLRTLAEINPAPHALEHLLPHLLLLGRQHALAGLDRHEARDRFAAAGDDEALAGLDART